MPLTIFVLPYVRDSRGQSPRPSICRYVGDARGDYYGESAGSFMVKEFE
jgi:hypothetical protein